MSLNFFKYSIKRLVTVTKPPNATRNKFNNISNFKMLFFEINYNRYILMQLNINNTKFKNINKLFFYN